MDRSEFERMVVRLEASSRKSPATYRVAVTLLVLLGFGVLAGIVGLAAAALSGLVALPVMLRNDESNAAGGAYVPASKLLLLLAIPLLFLIRASLSALFTRLPAPEGLEISADQAPNLFAALRSMHQRMKGPPFHHVLVSDELNAAMVKRPLFGLFGPGRNFLVLGLPLLECLSADEALAVVAHEYGHLAGSHGRFAAFVYRQRMTWHAVQVVAQHWGGVTGGLLRRVVDWYAPLFNAYTFVLARANEFAADAAAAELMGVNVTANALKRVDVAGEHYSAFMQQAFRQSLDDPAPPHDISLQWAGVAHKVPVDAATRWIRRSLSVSQGSRDTHPPLRERLGALSVDDVGAAQPPDNIDGPSAAQAWLGEHVSRIRRHVQAQWCGHVAEIWQLRYDEACNRRQRLARLQAIATATREQHADRLMLQLACDAGAALAADLESFIAAYPDMALGPYVEGCWRLSKGDESGLAHLERAMALDSTTIKPACERAHAYLSELDNPRADEYQQRWTQRDRFEREIAPALKHLDAGQDLRAPDLPVDRMDNIKAILRANRAGIARAYLARRILPADPALPTYVLGLALKPAPPRVDSPEQLAARVARAVPQAETLVVFVLEGKNAAAKRRLEELPNAEIAFQE